jgi:hypothetical protein
MKGKEAEDNVEEIENTTKSINLYTIFYLMSLGLRVLIILAPQ